MRENLAKKKIKNRIEKKQIQGIDLFRSDNRIPIEVNVPEQMTFEYHKQWLELLGFNVLNERAGFFNCTFPDGWSKDFPEYKNEWIYLLDDQGRRRAGIYFKIMDRRGQRGSFSSFINYITRYRMKIDHETSFDAETRNTDEYRNSALVGAVLDGQTEIFRAGRYELKTAYGDDLYNQEIKELRSKLTHDCSEWINENYPDHLQIDKYWE